MPVPTIAGNDLPDGLVIKDMFYTGKTINLTDGSRTVCAVDLTVGTILQADTHNQDGQGVLNTVGQPTAGFNGDFWVVIGTVPQNARRGGWVQCALAKNGAQIPTRTNGTLVAGTTRLGIEPGGASALGRLRPNVPTTVAHLLVSVAATVDTARQVGVANTAVASGAALTSVTFD